MRRLVATCCSVLLAAGAFGQVRPSRLYFGIDRPVPMFVEKPAEAQGPLSIALLTPTGEKLAAGEVAPGTIDLASLFPDLWSGTMPGTVRYAQLLAGEQPIGPAVVLQPLATPSTAALGADGRSIQWAIAPGIVSGVRAYVEQHAVMDTSEGEIVFRMRPDEAPNTVWNFLSLADGGFYTDVIFHRIVPGRGGGPAFVIQAGDPRGEGVGGPGYFIDLEPSKLPHDFGVLSMARSQSPDSNGSQVFVCLTRQATQALDGLYTSFGEAVSGGEAILAIERTPLGPDGSRPVEPPVIRSVRLVDAPPRGTGPEPVTRPEPALDTGR